MGLSFPTLPIAKKYTSDTAEEFGAVKGAPCTVESQEHDSVNHVTNVVLKWENSQGAVQRTTVEIPDGVGIASIAKTSTSGNVDTYTITLTNNTTQTFTVTNGIDGKDGKDGVDGVDGKDGKDGIDGKDGTPIYNWTSGASYKVGDLIIRDDKWYQCDVANSDIVFDSSKWHRVAVEGGESELSVNVTANLTVGAIASGTTVEEGTTFTEFVQKILVTEIAPTITFSLSKSGNVAYGGSYTETLTVNASSLGTAKKIDTIKWYEGNTLVHEDTIDSTIAGSWTYTMESPTTDTTTFKAVVTYTKSNDATADITKTASINFFYNKFYGAVDSLTPDEATIEALTTALGTAKGGTYSFSVNAGRIAYAYPSSLGALTSIKDGNGFSLFNSFTRTTQTYTQNGTSVSYYLYVLTDPTTVSGYSVVFA